MTRVVAPGLGVTILVIGFLLVLSNVPVLMAVGTILLLGGVFSPFLGPDPVARTAERKRSRREFPALSPSGQLEDEAFRGDFSFASPLQRAARQADGEDEELRRAMAQIEELHGTLQRLINENERDRNRGG